MHILDVGGDFESWSVVLLYDSASGDIVHVHESLTRKGGTHPDEQALERQAADLVTRHARQVDLKRLSFLHVDPQLLRKEVEYRVDPASRKLVERPASPKAPPRG